MEKLTMGQIRDMLGRAAEALENSYNDNDIALVAEIDDMLRHIDCRFISLNYPEKITFTTSQL